MLSYYHYYHHDLLTTPFSTTTVISRSPPPSLPQFSFNYYYNRFTTTFITNHHLTITFSFTIIIEKNILHNILVVKYFILGKTNPHFNMDETMKLKALCNWIPSRSCLMCHMDKQYGGFLRWNALR